MTDFLPITPEQIAEDAAGAAEAGADPAVQHATNGEPWYASRVTWGAIIAITAMAAATYLCRISGVALMSIIPLTPHVRRGLAALPGSIVVATVLPLIERLGLAAGLALLAAVAAMAVSRSELVALLTGMAAISAARFLGF